jgi:hypothetical protein
VASENNSNNKETLDENLTTSAETKAVETEKFGTPPSSATDKQNDAAKSAGAIAGRVFTKAKGLADSAPHG